MSHRNHYKYPHAPTDFSAILQSIMEEPTRQSLSDRMKAYEEVFEFRLPTGTPTILRLDGHGFSKFTSNFARPFDQRIHDAMTSTCSDLLSHFPAASLAYTQSDEITLVFPTGIQSFNDRIQKLCGLTASFTSVKFNLHLASAVQLSPEPPVRAEVLGNAHFDARLFSVPTVEEALNCVLWRCRGDAIRNSVGAFARTMYSTKELHGRNTEEVLQMMETEKRVVFKDVVPRWAVEGSMVKKEQYELEGRNFKTGNVEKTKRTRTRVVDKGMREFSEQNLKLITERYWT